MDKEFQIVPVGYIKNINNKFAIVIDEKYRPGLINIEGFSHLQLVWWGHLTDDAKSRERIVTENLFKKAPETIGVFSTRAPARPNPILISTIKVDEIDVEKGIVYTPFIDAEPGTLVLDIKPYFPMERVNHCKVPEWFEHWPKWAEDTKDFVWKDEINFDSV